MSVKSFAKTPMVKKISVIKVSNHRQMVVRRVGYQAGKTQKSATPCMWVGLSNSVLCKTWNGLDWSEME